MLANQPAPVTLTATHDGAPDRTTIASKAFSNIKTIFHNQYSSSYYAMSTAAT